MPIEPTAHALSLSAAPLALVVRLADLAGVLVTTAIFTLFGLLVFAIAIVIGAVIIGISLTISAAIQG